LGDFTICGGQCYAEKCFRRNVAKVAKKSDHNIDPVYLGAWVVLGTVEYLFSVKARR
jgi:hypothetical protein